MANEVSNELTIFGDEQELRRFKEHVAIPETGKMLDFEKVVPINNPTNDWRFDHIMSWGSKWNATSIAGGEIEDGCLRYYFESAWTPVRKVVRAMADQFPSLRFDYRYSEPGLDFSGQMLFENGALLSESEFEWGFIPFLRKWGNSNYPVEK